MKALLGELKMEDYDV
jgi:hypothetical protein